MNREVSLTNEYSKASPKVAVIFPTKNEENTIESVISVASKSNFNPDIMVVDAYSSDKTVELAVKAGATVNSATRTNLSRKRNSYESWIKRSN